MTPLNGIDFVNKFARHFGIEVHKEDIIHICNIFTMINNFLYDIKGNDAELKSTQLKSYIVYNELIKLGYEISANTYGETDWEGFLE